MGFWGTTLYANDCASDVRDDYKSYLKDGLNNDEAFQKIMSTCADCMGTDEEPLVWYALADTQWSLGRLVPEAKERALWWIENEGGMCFWQDSAKHMASWKKTLSKLMDKLSSPQPPEKKIRKPAPFVKNPWNEGDVYAYCFHTAEAEENGYYGKYILLQKLDDDSFFGETFSLIRAFDRIYDEIPTDVNLEALRPLPFAFPETYMPSGRNPVSPKLRICAVLQLDAKRFYPNAHLTYIGTYPVWKKRYNRVTWGYDYDWRWLEDALLRYHPLWQEYVYELLDDESIVKEKRFDTDNR